MVKLLPSKQVTRVRFSSPAHIPQASVAQRIEQLPSKQLVTGSIPVGGAYSRGGCSSVG